MNLSSMSLDEINAAYRSGGISTAEVTAYLRTWNAGADFSQAVISDGGIRTFDPEKSPFYQHLYKEFGVRG